MVFGFIRIQKVLAAGGDEEGFVLCDQVYRW
jgi:hypothetical protein